MNLEDRKILHCLQLMQQAIDDILEYAHNLTFDEFVVDKTKRQATQLNLIVLGEIAGRLLPHRTTHKAFPYEKGNFLLGAVAEAETRITGARKPYSSNVAKVC